MTDDNSQDENKLIAERRRKLGVLREQGNPFPNDFERNSIADELHSMYGSHENETLEQENVVVSVAGRGGSSFLLGAPEAGRSAWTPKEPVRPGDFIFMRDHDDGHVSFPL